MSDAWRYRKVLVTGCSGFLGSWLTGELLAEGAQVVGLVRDWVPQSRLLTEKLVSRIVTVRGDVEDLYTLERVLNEYEIDAVFHLAAQTIVGTANRDPLATFETNIKGTWNLLEACRRVGSVQRIIVASSDKAYGVQEQLPYDEATPLQGRFPYDVTKACADLLAQAYHATYGLPVCVTRCANFYGGGDLNFNRLVPGTILSVLKGERPVIRSDGTFVRDYLYIVDAARACMLLAEKMERLPIHGQAFNFSSEVRIEAREMAQHILTLMGREDLTPVILDQAENEIPAQYLSSARTRDLLGWTPQYPLEQGLQETIAWYRAFFQ
ncbi:MAG: GDP-mannose 4,6-dehydratase, partial [Dehalococcoidia bacterium]